MKTKRLIDADDLLIAFGNALNNATLKIGYGFMEWVVWPPRNIYIVRQAHRPCLLLPMRIQNGGLGV